MSSPTVWLGSGNFLRYSSKQPDATSSGDIPVQTAPAWMDRSYAACSPSHSRLEPLLGRLTLHPVVHPTHRPQAEAWILIKKLEPIGALSLLFRYGENSGDSMHEEAHFLTWCHYQKFF